MRQGRDENDAFAICQGRRREAADDPIKKILVLIEMDYVILRGRVSQEVIPRLRIARQIRGGVHVRVQILHRPSPMISFAPKRGRNVLAAGELPRMPERDVCRRGCGIGPNAGRQLAPGLSHPFRRIKHFIREKKLQARQKLVIPLRRKASYSRVPMSAKGRLRWKT